MAYPAPPRVVSGVPSALYRRTVGAGLPFPPSPQVPATTSFPSASWTRALIVWLDVLGGWVTTRPLSPNPASGDPSALTRPTANPPVTPADPATAIWPSAWTTTAAGFWRTPAPAGSSTTPVPLNDGSGVPSGFNRSRTKSDPRRPAATIRPSGWRATAVPAEPGVGSWVQPGGRERGVGRPVRVEPRHGQAAVPVGRLAERADGDQLPVGLLGHLAEGPVDGAGRGELLLAGPVERVVERPGRREPHQEGRLAVAHAAGQHDLAVGLEHHASVRVGRAGVGGGQAATAERGVERPGGRDEAAFELADGQTGTAASGHAKLHESASAAGGRGCRQIYQSDQGGADFGHALPSTRSI